MTKTFFTAIILIIFNNLFAQESRELAIGKADAIVDLRTKEGAELVRAQWRFSEATIVETNFNAAGADLKPSGAPIKTNDIVPKGGAIDFDDSNWEILDPTSLETRKGTGKVSFCWYRINVTIPDKIANLEAGGTTAVFEILLDDYSEITVNGVLQKTFGQSGSGVIAGYNARNRVVLTHHAQPGQKFQVAVFGINGPLSEIPDNYIWIRSCTVDFYKDFNSHHEWKNVGEVARLDPSIDNIIAPGTMIEKVADGFQFTEGPVWSPDGFLLFSDPNTNVIYELSHEGNISIYKTKSGYSGFDIGEYHQPGSNGLAFDKEGRLTIDQHGNRRVVRVEKNGVTTVLADNYEGKKFNSPNDLVYRSDDVLYFTDPPYGLPKAFDDPKKELPYSGVYCVKDGHVKLVADDLKGPNGIAFSPDEKYLYVDNWDITDINHTKVIMRYEVNTDGTLRNGKIFFNMNDQQGDIALDGIKTDVQGNLFVSGPGGIWIISPEAKLLGKIITPEHAANMAWGEDGKTLFITASSGVYKIRVSSGGTITAMK